MNKIINKTKSIFYVFSILVLNMFIANGVKAEKWQVTDKPVNVPTDTTSSDLRYCTIIIGTLFVLSLLALIVSIVNYLKVKDEQKKKKARKNMRRFSIIFTVVFVLSVFWFIILLPSFCLIGGVFV